MMDFELFVLPILGIEVGLAPHHLLLILLFLLLLNYFRCFYVLHILFGEVGATEGRVLGKVNGGKSLIQRNDLNRRAGHHRRSRQVRCDLEAFFFPLLLLKQILTT